MYLYCRGRVPFLSHSAQWRSYMEAETEVTQGTAHVLSSKTPTLTSQLTQTEKAARAQHWQTGFWRQCRLQAWGMHCRAAHSSCDLQAGFDKVTTCAARLFLTRKETPWKLTSWSCSSLNLKIILWKRTRCHSWAQNSICLNCKLASEKRHYNNFKPIEYKYS